MEFAVGIWQYPPARGLVKKEKIGYSAYSAVHACLAESKGWVGLVGK